MAVFQLKQVIKNYGDRTVLNIDRLELQRDQIHCIMGPNGSGKTTLLKILNLLDEPDSGEILFLGEKTNGNTARRLEMQRRMCMVFQRPYMFRATVYANVAYGLRLRGIKRRDAHSVVMEALDFVGMTDFKDHHARKLSGGEMQRVALARALALQPQVLLLDEPTANLDPSSVQLIEGIIKECQQRYHTSVIMVTHNIFQARRISNTSLLLFGGEVIEQQATEQVFSHPRDERTRQFIDGTMVY